MTGVEPETGVLSSSVFGEYHGIDNLYPDVVVVTPTGSTFHLPAASSDEAAAACTEDAQWDRVAVELAEAQRANFSPCRKCFKPVADFFAQHPDPPIEVRGDGGQIPTPQDSVELDENSAKASRPPLTAPTEDVLTISNQTIMHAPTGDGALCGVEGDLRRVSRRAVEANHDYCQECFEHSQGEIDGEDSN